MPEEKKSLFDRAIDALTDRDEKEAAAKAAQEKAQAEAARKEAEARARMAAEKAAADKVAVDKAAALQAANEKAAALKSAREKAAQDLAADRAAATPKKGVVTVRSLRIRADHNTASEVVGGLVDGNEVTILGTWSDGKSTWGRLENGWAAMVYDGETYIKLI